MWRCSFLVPSVFCNPMWRQYRKSVYIWRITSLLGKYCIRVRCRYNAVNFLQNYHNRHRIAHPWGRGMGCLLWLLTLMHVLLQSLLCWVQNRMILKRVITAPDCIWNVNCGYCWARVVVQECSPYYHLNYVSCIGLMCGVYISRLTMLNSNHSLLNIHYGTQWWWVRSIIILWLCL